MTHHHFYFVNKHASKVLYHKYRNKCNFWQDDCATLQAPKQFQVTACTILSDNIEFKEQFKFVLHFQKLLAEAN